MEKGQASRLRIYVENYNMEVTSFGVAAQLGFKTKVLTDTIQVGLQANDAITVQPRIS